MSGANVCLQQPYSRLTDIKLTTQKSSTCVVHISWQNRLKTFNTKDDYLSLSTAYYWYTDTVFCVVLI